MPMDYSRYAQLISYMRDIGLPLPTEYKGSFGRDDLVTAIGFAAFARQDGRAAAEAASGGQPANRVAGLLQALREIIFPRIGEIVRDIVGERPDRPALPIACGAGCGHCCYQNVDVTIPEAILAAQALADPGDPRRAAVLSTAQRLAGLDSRQRNKTGLPCPFLVDEQCSIYERRPILCRTVLSPDSGRCQAALATAIAGSGDFKQPVYSKPQLHGFAFFSAVRGICKDLGLQYDLVDLVQTVAAILREPGLVDRWAAGEAVFRPVGQAGRPGAGTPGLSAEAS